MDFLRTLNLTNLLKQKSFFLFGPRTTGKSYLARHQLPNTPIYNLLHAPTFDRLSRAPTLIGEESHPGELVVIDEIQKLPRLLDEVHRLIEEKQMRFLLTGSSARKLKRGAANLLAGRAWEARLFPLTYNEIPDFDINRYLHFGGLPAVYGSSHPWEELRAYSGTYLQEEISAEAAVRNFDAFVRFLDLAATKVAEEMNFESLASDCGVSGRSIRNYFELLEDTLIGFQLPPYQKTKRRKAVSRSKFYLFDLGVTNSLLGRREVIRSSDDFGRCFEHFLILELRAFLSYYRRDEKLMFWRSQSGFEVDVIVGTTAIEIKATDLVHERHLKGIRALREEGLMRNYIVISQDPSPREIDGIQILPWKEFLNRMWKGELIV